jgi:hypothetical protein
MWHDCTQVSGRIELQHNAYYIKGVLRWYEHGSLPYTLSSCNLTIHPRRPQLHRGLEYLLVKMTIHNLPCHRYSFVNIVLI